MFLDGVTYAAISNNLSQGYGEIFRPHYTKTLYPIFYEHPPLVFIVQSVFFELLGDSYMTEKVFSFMTAILTAWAIVKCWTLLSGDVHVERAGWLPVLLWLSIPLVSWSYKNNILENSLSVFSTFAVFFILKSILRKKYIYLIPGSCLIMMAFLSKGFVGLFPLAVPLVYWLVYGFSGRLVKTAIYLYLISAFLLLTSLWSFPDLRLNLENYIMQQVMPSLSGSREITTDSRFNIIFQLIPELVIPLILGGLLLLLSNKQLKFSTFVYSRQFWLFLLIGLTASLPIMISMKQRKFYLLPSLPFYALAIGYLTAPFLADLKNRLSNRVNDWIKRLAIIVLATTLLLSYIQFGEYSRNKEQMNDVLVLSDFLREGSVVGTTQENWENWSLVANLCRFGYLSLEINNDHRYFLAKKDHIPEKIPPKYDPVKLALVKYTLYEKKSEN